jgi:glycosyltransferase involved in cell wall biosynthesis
MQEVDFDFELIVADDCSTDNTLDMVRNFLCESFIANYRILDRPANLGMQKNWQDALQNAKGKYIAICEGDDYWTSSNKLKKQINFLESNIDYAICFHRVHQFENDKKPEFSNLNSSLKEETYSIQDLSKGNFIHTPSVVLRNGLIAKMPEWFKDSPVCDYVLYLLNAKHGLIKYFPEAMAVYRMNTGIWSSQQGEVMAKAWLKVMTLLLGEDFGMETNVLIKNHWRHCANAYLNWLFPYNMARFIEELQALSKIDESILYDWAYNHYPNFIKDMLASKAFKIGKKISSIRNKMRYSSHDSFTDGII